MRDIDGGIRAAGYVALILVVPVGDQHQEHLQPGELARADKRVVGPRPAVLLEQLLDRRVVELEPRLDEAAGRIDRVGGTSQRSYALDGARRSEVGDLGVVPAGPGQAHRERL